MKKSDIASHVASLTSLSKAAGTVAVNAVFTAIADTHPKGETITVTGFGTFTTRMRPRTRRTLSAHRRTDRCPDPDRPVVQVGEDPLRDAAA